MFCFVFVQYNCGILDLAGTETGAEDSSDSN